MPDEIEVLTLTNIGKGALPELFQRELAAVLENIADVNTGRDKKRTITIELSFEPFEDRDGAQIEIVCKTKLAGVKAVRSTVFIDKREGRIVAVPQDLTQRQLFGPTQDNADVLPMDKKKGVN